MRIAPDSEVRLGLTDLFRFWCFFCWQELLVQILAWLVYPVIWPRPDLIRDLVHPNPKPQSQDLLKIWMDFWTRRGLGFRVSGFGVEGFRPGFQGLGLRVSGLEFEGLGLRA